MYRHCIYCSADLKANEAIEGFPVGRTIAFDAAKGRLWAICGKCARWNLAPLEERWEPIEQAEKAFRDTQLRVQSENVGVARLPDSSRLIPIGAAQAGEIAAWRYGGELLRRRRRWQLTGGVASAVGVGAAAVQLAGLVYAAGGIAAGATIYSVGKVFWDLYAASLPVGHARDAETRSRHLVRRRDLNGAFMDRGGEGLPRLVLPMLYPEDAKEPIRVDLAWGEFQWLLGRALCYVNRKGARRGEVAVAIRDLEEAGGPQRLLARAAERRLGLGVALTHAREPVFGKTPLGVPGLAGPATLALEMALHEQEERRALEGELAVLEAAWREAEEIAGIADRLAIAPSER